MTSTTDAFINKLLGSSPDLSTVMKQHMEDNDVLLPYVFMADVARYVTGGGRQSETVLIFLENWLNRGEDEVKNLIAVGFLEAVHDALPLGKGNGYPELMREWRRQEAGQ